MEKEFKSRSCDVCSSSNVKTIKKYISDINTRDENNIKTIELKKNYLMKCNDCDNEFIIEYLERYHLYEPSLIGQLGDIELLASYETQDSSNHNYDLISIVNTPYDDDSLDDKIYLLCGDDKYPIKISKEKAEEIIKEIKELFEKSIETSVDKKLTYNTYMGRNK